VADGLAALDQILVEVRDPDEPYEAVVHEAGHRCPRLLDRDAALVRPVELIQVEVLGAESPQAPLAGRSDLFGAEPRPFGHGGDLGGEPDLVPATRHRLTDELLRPAPAVDLGRVDPIDAAVEHAPDGVQHLALGRWPAPFGATAGLPGSEPDHGQLRTL